MGSVSLVPSLSPHGRLALTESPDATPLDDAIARRLSNAFARGSGHGLLQLGAGEAGSALPAVFSYWREFSASYVTVLCAQQDRGDVAPPSVVELQRLVEAAPPMTGAEYLSEDMLAALWGEIDTALGVELAESKLGIQEFLKQRNPAWNLVGRVHFNLAENRKDPEAPFAFLATYTTRLTAHAKAQHLPLGKALSEYAGAANKDRLLSLLVPVQRASETCPWLRTLIDEGEIFHPLRWTPAEAIQLLRDVPQLESAGVVVRMPAAWKANRPPRPQVSAKIGGKAPSGVGKDALLDFQMEVTLDGERLSAAEIRDLLKNSEGLALIRGRWVEVDRERLGHMLERFREIESAAAKNGLSFQEAVRLLAGANVGSADDAGEERAEWSQVAAGEWLGEMLRGLRSPEGLAQVDPGAALKATLRPYQQVGVRWLYLLAKLGLGACLADDMGLGKTIQVLALLESRRGPKKKPRAPSLVVAPRSLIHNWIEEARRFTPQLRVLDYTGQQRNEQFGNFENCDLVMTTYGTLRRDIGRLKDFDFNYCVLDEAQSIKNADSHSAKACRLLRARHRLAMTGTPVENHLGELWSLFEFLNPGMLGRSAALKRLSASAPGKDPAAIEALAKGLRPFLLRRTKEQVLSELPEKTEQTLYCQLEKKQRKLYDDLRNHYRDLLTKRIDSVGLKKSKIQVLEALLRLRQAACHPGLIDPKQAGQPSAKLEALLEQLKEVLAEGHKALVFSQFTSLLAIVRKELDRRAIAYEYLDGKTRNRKEKVDRFQENPACPLFLISLKAGGLGLNLTAADYVFILDPWWNPAVEAQAVDRAHRIGQTRRVFAYRLIARDTVEEKILELQRHKQKLAEAIVSADNSLIRSLTADDLRWLLS